MSLKALFLTFLKFIKNLLLPNFNSLNSAQNDLIISSEGTYECTLQHAILI